MSLFLPLDELRAVRDLTLPGPMKGVLTALILRADGKGQSFAGYERLAADAGLKPRSVKAIMPKLVAAGHVTVAKRSADGRSLSNLYTVHVVHPGVHDDHPGVHEVHGEGASGSPPGVHDDHRGGCMTITRSAHSDLPIGTAHVTDPGSGEPAGLTLTVIDATKPKPKAVKREATHEHREVIGYFRETFLRLRGCEPEIVAKDHVAVNRLLANGRTVADVKSIIDRAFADPFVAEKKPDLAYIAGNVNAYVGTAPTLAKGRAPRHVVQRDDAWEGT